jgi:hypothetical protein
MLTANIAEDDLDLEMTPGELNEGEKAVYNAIGCEERRRDFLKLVRQRVTLEVVTPAGARNGRSSMVSSLTSTVELTAKERNGQIAEVVGKLFRKWKFVSKTQACYGGRFCKEVYEGLGQSMEAGTWEGKNGIKRKAMNEISRKRSTVTGRMKQVFVCK